VSGKGIAQVFTRLNLMQDNKAQDTNCLIQLNAKDEVKKKINKRWLKTCDRKNCDAKLERGITSKKCHQQRGTKQL